MALKVADAVAYCCTKAASADRYRPDRDAARLGAAGDNAKRSITEMEYEAAKGGAACSAAEQHEADSRQARRTSAEYWRHIGALAFLHDTAKAMAAYEKAVALDPDNADGWRYLGELQFRRGDLAAAAKSFAALVEHGKRTNDKRAESTRLPADSAWIYRDQGDLARAEAMTLEALHLAPGWNAGTARAYTNLGIIHGTRGDLAKAEEMHRKALALDEELGSEEGMARDYANLGVIHRIRGELAKAEEMYCKALALHEELGSKESMARDHWYLGCICHDSGQKTMRSLPVVGARRR